ncbi:putative cobalt import ATP-binding protein CbiO [Gordonia polyisoprenivorans VH2]|uniref:ABC transporter ATP-binding protein n=2 Tax=Gordonia polyisoprenivorans TaxID=84595 RepID=A0A846WT44_9ACTN|nr:MULTISPECIES: ABC transporter ATP-binding protein [Gordonia]AFA72869.1 putative cobalt import ATP-binding protein CbiO [Gordonia polyisoprenivorans VH2]MBE7192741.1 ABC transporter ATP-binding protein [Gordonia polyisoprenivorans]MDF3285254.1 ABC transporter ATP-binding protein [Gordonia sp. N1V]NKY04695.1 ABC transporter ATP-binding protein [Gordonia polyisoprenivorans]OPX15976.1 cobalt ABC transporter ATP-binding protein [Gordonia sp. i37]
MTPAIEIAGLRYAYPDGHLAIDHLDLVVEPGERIALLGPNGAGKTTLMLQLNGVLLPSAGSVTVHGSRVGKDTLREVRRRVGLVFQDPDDQLFMPTLAEDVAFGPANFGVRGDELADRVQEALAAVSMTEHARRSPHHLSGGQRRRGALASVLACRPDILVLDEPSANLDPQARRELADTLLTLRTTMLVVTHDLLYAAQLCDRAVVLDAGRVVADGDVDDILSDSELLAAHRLEMPWGFDIDAVRRARSAQVSAR